MMKKKHAVAHKTTGGESPSRTDSAATPSARSRASTRLRRESDEGWVAISLECTRHLR